MSHGLSRRAQLVIPFALIALAGCADTIATAPRLGREARLAQGDNGVWTVNSLIDPGLHGCDETECTLRGAVVNAAPGDRIVFASGLQGRITLIMALEIINDVSIDGDNRIIVERWSSAPAGRTVHVMSGNVTLSRLMVTGGRNLFDVGGGILVASGNVTLDGMRVQANEAGQGGGLYVSPNAVVTVRNSTFDLNFSPSGGAIANHGALTLDRSTIVANTSMTNGGQIENFGILTTDASLIGPSFYTGIINHPNAQATVTRSTIYGNSASATTGLGTGGGIHNVGALHLRSSTVVENIAPNGVGGIYNGGSMTAMNSIVISNNGNPECGGPNAIGSLGFNLTSTGGGCSFTAAGDVAIDLALAYTNLFEPGLQDHGGPTWTMALEPGGLAEDAGSCAGQTADQRGLTRPVDNPLYANAADGCDIGAYEIQLTPGQKVTVVANAVTVLALPKGTSTSLQTKLTSVQTAIAAGDIASACMSLTAFINEVNAQAGKKKISAADAANLVALATALKSELGCA